METSAARSEGPAGDVTPVFLLFPGVSWSRAGCAARNDRVLFAPLQCFGVISKSFGQITENNTRPRTETILYTALKFEFDRACFHEGEASSNFVGKVK